MAMRKDFCTFILTHGRPDRVYTYKTLLRAGYTGKIYIVIDDEDETAGEYRNRYGDRVLQFCKREVAEWTDDGDNFGHRKSVIYARNICWELARRVKCKYFIQLDDDYMRFSYPYNSAGRYVSTRIKRTMDDLLSALLQFFIDTDIKTIAMSQGGDWIGGGKSNNLCLRRKAMNSFICSIERQFSFFGRINEDTTTYTSQSRLGYLFFTVMQAKLNQLATQSNPGGWTEHYLSVGTYIKTFYSIMYSPSCIQVGIIGDPRTPALSYPSQDQLASNGSEDSARKS